MHSTDETSSRNKKEYHAAGKGIPLDGLMVTLGIYSMRYYEVIDYGLRRGSHPLSDLGLTYFALLSHGLWSSEKL